MARAPASSLPASVAGSYSPGAFDTATAPGATGDAEFSAPGADGPAFSDPGALLASEPYAPGALGLSVLTGTPVRSVVPGTPGLAISGAPNSSPSLPIFTASPFSLVAPSPVLAATAPSLPAAYVAPGRVGLSINISSSICFASSMFSATAFSCSVPFPSSAPVPTNNAA